MHIASGSRCYRTVVELRAGIAWGLVVLGLTLVILVLGAIVLPAQAYETPARVPAHRLAVINNAQIYQP